MTITRNLTLIFAKVPQGLPKVGIDLIIRDESISMDSSLAQGTFITKNLYSSFDPYMRKLLVGPGEESYRPPFTLNGPVTAACIARVVASAHEDYAVGMDILARLPVQEYSLITHEYLQTLRNPPTRLQDFDHVNDQRLFLGPLGMPGLTAYSSLHEIGHPKAGETIFVSAASGAVGQMVGQMARNIGLRVIGSVGSKEKVNMTKQKFGYHEAFNYKDEAATDALTRLAPDGLDIYYDNVGGEQLDAALGKMKKGGRIIVSGMVSQYNLPPESRYGVKNLFQFVAQGLKMQGFQVGDADFGPKWRSRRDSDVIDMMQRGHLVVEMSETVGIEHAGRAFVGMLEGRNTGKAILKIHPEDGDNIDGEYHSFTV